MNGSHEMDSNLNISPKMSYGVLDIIMLQNYMLIVHTRLCTLYVITKGCYLCWTLYIHVCAYDLIRIEIAKMNTLIHVAKLWFYSLLHWKQSNFSTVVDLEVRKMLCESPDNTQ